MIADPADNIVIDASALTTGFVINSGINVWIEGLTMIAPQYDLAQAVNNAGITILKDINIYEVDGGTEGISLENSGELTILGTSNIKQDD